MSMELVLVLKWEKSVIGCALYLFHLCVVVCEVPEARLSVNDKTTDSDKVYFNTKHDCTVYTQVEIS